MKPTPLTARTLKDLVAWSLARGYWMGYFKAKHREPTRKEIDELARQTWRQFL